MKIARIVRSNSHVDYVGRVLDRLEVADPPAPSDYGFAQFVRIPTDDSEIVGVVYDSLLINPNYGDYGPRLSPRADLEILSPDYLDELGVLIGILVLGWWAGNEAHQAIPRRVIPVAAEVYRMTADEVRRFHLGRDGRLRLHYFSQIMKHAREMAIPLIGAIIEQLESFSSEEERRRLCVLKKTLTWQQTFQNVRS